MNDVFPHLDTHPNGQFAAPPKSTAGRWLGSAIFISLALLAGGGVYTAQQYNAIQTGDETAEAERQQLLSQYKRRMDLIPNLVTVVRSYAAHESAIFEDITQASARAANLSAMVAHTGDPSAMEKFEQAQRQLSLPLSRLLVVADRYPELKSNELFRDLMAQLEGTENRIAYSRQRCIESIANYNLSIRRFPNNLIARQAGYEPKEKFSEISEPAIALPLKVELK